MNGLISLELFTFAHTIIPHDWLHYLSNFFFIENTNIKCSRTIQSQHQTIAGVILCDYCKFICIFNDDRQVLRRWCTLLPRTRIVHIRLRMNVVFKCLQINEWRNDKQQLSLAPNIWHQKHRISFRNRKFERKYKILRLSDTLNLVS